MVQESPDHVGFFAGLFGVGGVCPPNSSGGGDGCASCEGVSHVMSEGGESEEGMVEEEGEDRDGKGRESWCLCRPFTMKSEIQRLQWQSELRYIVSKNAISIAGVWTIVHTLFDQNSVRYHTCTCQLNGSIPF